MIEASKVNLQELFEMLERQKEALAVALSLLVSLGFDLADLSDLLA